MLQNDRREVVGRWHVAHHRVEEVGVEVLLHDRLGDLTLGVAARERVRRPLKVVEQRRRLVRTLLRDEDGLPDGVHSVKHVLHGRGERRGAGEDNARVEGRVARPSREDKREENLNAAHIGRVTWCQYSMRGREARTSARAAAVTTRVPGVFCSFASRSGTCHKAGGISGGLRREAVCAGDRLHRPDVHVLHKLRVQVLLAEEHLRGGRRLDARRLRVGLRRMDEPSRRVALRLQPS